RTWGLENPGFGELGGLENLGFGRLSFGHAQPQRVGPGRRSWAPVLGAGPGTLVSWRNIRSLYDGGWGRAFGCLPTLNAGCRADIRLPPRKGRRRSLVGPTAARSAWRETAHAAGRRSQTRSALLRAGERRAGAPALRAAGSRVPRVQGPQRERPDRWRGRAR